MELTSRLSTISSRVRCYNSPCRSPDSCKRVWLPRRFTKPLDWSFEWKLLEPLKHPELGLNLEPPKSNNTVPNPDSWVLPAFAGSSITLKPCSFYPQRRHNACCQPRTAH